MISVFQVGSRRSYATSEIFFRHGLLDRLFTDIFISPQISRILGRIGHSLNLHTLISLSGRSNEIVPLSKVVHAPFFSLSRHLKGRRFASLSETLASSLAYSSGLERIFEDRMGVPSTLYAVNREASHLGAAVVDRGGHFIVEQTIPPLEDEIGIFVSAVRRFEERGINIPNPFGLLGDLDWFFEREFSELRSATRIVCVSRYVRDRLLKFGLSESVLRVVESGVRLPPVALKVQPRSRLKILFVGQFGFRKGAIAFLELAKRLEGIVDFRVIGDISLPRFVRSDFSNVDFVGRLPRRLVGEHWRWADLLLFPSINEGAAMVTFEALANGVPVLCTHQSGSMVEPGVDGFLFHPWEIDEMEEKIREIAKSQDALAALKEACFSNRWKVSIDAYSERLVAAVSDLV